MLFLTTLVDDKLFHCGGEFCNKGLHCVVFHVSQLVVIKRGNCSKREHFMTSVVAPVTFSVGA